MKNLSLKLLSIICLSSLLFSCEQDENLQPEGQWTLSQPSLVTEGLNNTIILDETTPNENITLSWAEAESSAGFAVTYEVMIDRLESDFSNPAFVQNSANNGRGNSFIISYSTIDSVLSLLGIGAGETSEVLLAVRANSLTKSTLVTTSLKLQRFITEEEPKEEPRERPEELPSQLFISGSATENGADIENAIPLKRLTDNTGALSNKYEVYTSLIAGGSYLFYDQQSEDAFDYGINNTGNIEVFGNAITAQEGGVYRISVDLDNNTFSLLKIDFWSMVGAPIVNAWEGDEPLMYQGNGIFSATINLINTGGFVFRANGDWAYVLKRVVDTPNTLVFEADAPSQGLVFEDIPSELTGLVNVTLDLSANSYTYTLESDNTVIENPDDNTNTQTPSELYLFENGVMIQQFTRSNENTDIFSIETYTPLQANSTYLINSAADGSGISYSVNGNIADSNNPDGDKVSGVETLLLNDNTFTVPTDRGVSLVVDFSNSQIIWTYYNFKLFHWIDWPQRVENVMTYVHPNTFVVTASLTAGYNSRFITPWDFQLGSSATVLVGQAINGESEVPDIVNIENDGTYMVTLTLNSDYQSGNFEFVQQ